MLNDYPEVTQPGNSRGRTVQNTMHPGGCISNCKAREPLDTARCASASQHLPEQVSGAQSRVCCLDPNPEWNQCLC
jgi:hypothetical protein